MVFALGLGDALVGVTHECDYPPEAAGLPQVTRTNIPPGLASREIDVSVRATLDSLGSLYELDLERLERLQPDLILTQRLCSVCAVSTDRVEPAALSLPSRPQVLNLEPHSLDDILDSIRVVGAATGREASATAVVAGLERRIDAVRANTSGLTPRPRVSCMEWVDPPFCGGHWMKELVELAGGVDALARAGEPSRQVAWQAVMEFAPEVLVLTCCGFSLERCLQEAQILRRYAGFEDLPAAQSGSVYATDGSAYFSRRGRG